MLSEFLHPDLSAGTQAFIRTAYGVLMTATLLQALPEARRFFLSERWGGYARRGRAVDLLQNPVAMPLVMAVWFAAAVSIALGWLTPWAALINLVLCRYFFIVMRWKGILRGMGAPGFIAYWLAMAVFLLEYTSRFAPGMRQLAVLVAQVDLSLIMISAGVYKATAGYPRNHGMELGLCNPMWGYWWRRYIALPPNHAVYWVLNQLAWGTEVAAGIMMLLPPTRELGGLLLAVSFIFILTQIRLGFLCEMVAAAALLYVQAGSTLDQWIASVGVPAGIRPAAVAVAALPTFANNVFAAALWGYLLLLPLAHAGLYYNFYARRRLPGQLQGILDRYTNLFGLIIWRVFSVDLVNFFIRIHAEPRGAAPSDPQSGIRAEPRRAGPLDLPDGERRLVSRLGRWPRFNHVGEMICLTSLFTTLKYYPSNDALFRERLLRYAGTLPRHPDEVLVFEYVSIAKRADRFDWVPVAEYRVDVDAAAVEERLLDPAFSARAPHAVSPVHEGAIPGSYAPVKR